jgi:hypothetical protein
MNQKMNITFSKVLEMMKNDKSMTLYEYYDGLQVNDKYLVDGDGACLGEFQEKILELLPDTQLEYFTYESRFPSEIEFSGLKAIPHTLVSLRLANFQGIPKRLKREIKEKGIKFIDVSKDDI